MSRVARRELGGRVNPRDDASLDNDPRAVASPPSPRPGRSSMRSRPRESRRTLDVPERLGDLAPARPWCSDPRPSRRPASLSETQRGVLDRTARRIEAFAAAQMAGLTPVEVPMPGGRTGLRYQPVDRARLLRPAADASPCPAPC